MRINFHMQSALLLHIELYPTTESREKEIFENYCASTYKKEYDFADYHMCSVLHLISILWKF